MDCAVVFCIEGSRRQR